MRGGGFIAPLSLVVGLLSPVVGSTGASAAARLAGRSTVATDKAKPSAEVTVRPDAVSALSAARAEGHRVEVSDADGSNVVTYANPDASFTRVVSQQPVRISQGGTWLPVDTSLIVSGGSVHPRAAAVGLRLSGGGDQSLVSVTGGRATFGLGWGQTLPAPRLSGDTATYVRASGAGEDVTVRALPSGFEASIVLNQRPAGNIDPQFLLTGNGLRFIGQPDGSIEVTGNGGSPVAVIDVPVMRDRASHVGAVTMSVIETGAGPVLSLLPDQSFLSSPTTVYPVTVDPTVGYATSSSSGYFQVGGTMVNSYVTGMNGDYEPVGLSSAGHVYRTLYSFTGLSNLVPTGDHMIGASVKLTLGSRDYPADLSAPLVLWQTGSWSAHGQPPSELNELGTGAGDPASGPNGSTSYATLTLPPSWSVAATENFEVRAADETNSNTFTYLATSASLSVTYDSPPTVTPIGCSGSAYGPNFIGPNCYNPWEGMDPTFSATGSSPLGLPLRIEFDVWTQGFSGTEVASGWASQLYNGTSAVTWTMPTGLLQGDGQYQLREQAFDGYLYSGWSNWGTFSVQPAPASPSISWSSYPAGTWSAYTSTPAVVTLSSGQLPINAYEDGHNVSSLINNSGSAFWVPAPGWHNLKVQYQDDYGQWSPWTTYSFGVGSGGVSSPSTVTGRYFNLSATAATTESYVDFWYRLGPNDPNGWRQIPVGDITDTTTGNPVGSWPIPLSNSALYMSSDSLRWDANNTIGLDTPLQVRTCFYDSTQTNQVCMADSTATNLQLDREQIGGDYAHTNAGPGTVSLINGDYQVQASDVSIPDLNVTRRFDSVNPTAMGPLGAGWALATPDENSDTDFASLTATTTGAVVTASDGTEFDFTANPDGSYTAVGEAAADALQLVDNGGFLDLFTESGSEIEWNEIGTSPLWHILQITSPNTQYTYYQYDSTNRLQEIFFEPGVGCSDSGFNVGCRSLVFNYDANSGLLTNIVYKYNLANMATVTVAQFSYNTSGQLASEYDPRLPSLITSYSYDSAGRLSSISPSGTAAWNFAYDSAGRIQTVSQTHDAAWGGGAAATTVTYDVPLQSSTLALPDMTTDSSGIETWDQHDDPVTATAVFPAGHTPANLEAPTASEYSWAALYYADSNGLLTNTAGFGATATSTGSPATPGWQVTTTEYSTDGKSNVIRTLSADNRAMALASSNPVSTADALDSRDYYSIDGTELIDTYGPSHQITLPGGATVTGRTHTHNIYDQGKPGNSPYYLLTTTTTGAYEGTDAPVGGPPAGSEVQDITTEYFYSLGSDTTGWTLRIPLETIADPGGLNQITTASYDSYGNQLTSVLPAGNAAGATENSKNAHTTYTAYYTNSTTANPPQCYNPAYVNLVCMTGPSGPNGYIDTTVTGVPYSQVMSYTPFGQPISTVETVTDTTGRTQTRTTNYSYDAGSRLTAIATTNSDGSLVNGGFESGGLGGWVSAGTADVTTMSVHSGIYAAQVGPSPNGSFEDSSITESFTAPSGATGVSLWYNETCQTYDSVSANLTDLTNRSTTTFMDSCGSGQGWQQATGQVTAGHSYSLTLAVHPGTGNSSSSVLFDDIAFTTTTGTVNSAAPLTSINYDPTTGLIDSQSGNDPSQGTLTVSYGYDDFGQQTSYTDADGATTTTSYDLEGRPTQVSSTHGTTTYTYDQNGEHRGLLTSESDSALTAGSFTTAYDAGDNLAAETYPNGLTATRATDPAGQVVALNYSIPGQPTPIMSFGAGKDATGQDITTTSPASSQIYTYDNVDRLTQTQDTVFNGGTSNCSVRGYTYDSDSNRTSLATIPGTSATCPTSGGTTTTNTYDIADRIQNTGYNYDAFGNTVTVPSVDAGGNGNLTVSYYANDLAASETLNGQSMTWRLDPVMRAHAYTDPSGVTHTNHYGDDSDSPIWTDEGNGNWTRNITGTDGMLAAIEDQTGTATLQLVNLHGDIVATMSATTTSNGLTSYDEATEFGTERTSSGARYTWLGGDERSESSLGNLVLMGERLYDPGTGRFLQTDPVPGGNSNAYVFPQDPVNSSDLTGFARDTTGDFGSASVTPVANPGVSPDVTGSGAGAAPSIYRKTQVSKLQKITGEVEDGSDELEAGTKVLGGAATIISGGVTAGIDLAHHRSVGYAVGDGVVSATAGSVAAGVAGAGCALKAGLLGGLLCAAAAGAGAAHYAGPYGGDVGNAIESIGKEVSSWGRSHIHW